MWDLALEVGVDGDGLGRMAAGRAADGRRGALPLHRRHGAAGEAAVAPLHDQRGDWLRRRDCGGVAVIAGMGGGLAGCSGARGGGGLTGGTWLSTLRTLLGSKWL